MVNLEIYTKQKYFLLSKNLKNILFLTYKIWSILSQADL